MAGRERAAQGDGHRLEVREALDHLLADKAHLPVFKIAADHPGAGADAVGPDWFDEFALSPEQGVLLDKAGRCSGHLPGIAEILAQNGGAAHRLDASILPGEAAVVDGLGSVGQNHVAAARAGIASPDQRPGQTQLDRAQVLALVQDDVIIGIGKGAFGDLLQPHQGNIAPVGEAGFSKEHLVGAEDGPDRPAVLWRQRCVPTKAAHFQVLLQGIDAVSLDHLLNLGVEEVQIEVGDIRA